MTMPEAMENARLIAESAAEFATGTGGVARARSMRDKWPQFDQAIWQQMSGLGWLGILVPEAQGGLGLGPHEMCALQEAVGASLLPEPLAPAMAAAAMLGECGSDAAAAPLAGLIAGERLWSMAPAPLAGLSFPLQLPHVPDCYPGAALLVAQGAGEAFQIRAIDTAQAGIDVRMAECVDGSVLADLLVDQSAWSRAATIARGSSAQAAWEKGCDAMLLAYSAYLVGLMNEALQLTLGYMKVRTQFGTPIGAFQALQHRAASCHVDILSSRALLYEACNAFASGARARAAAAIKARASAAALRVTKECVQFHGAIGFADEHDIGLYLRKAMTVAARQGGELQQKLRYGRMLAGGGGSAAIPY